MRYALMLLLLFTPSAQAATATFAGGCFWCMEADFEGLDGVEKVVSGYTGGTKANPTYEEVSSGNTGHVEAIQVTYDEKKVPYSKLLERFWDNVDPTDAEGQFCDKGSQYAAGIFYHTEEEKKLAEASKEKVAAKLKQPLAAFIKPASAFYEAEGHHQDYYKNNAVRYNSYKYGCGRPARLEELKKEMQ